MAIEHVIDSLKQLQQLHQNLLAISKDKTEVLKKGDIDGLQALLKQERKYVKAINQVEQARIDATKDWANAQGLDPEEATATDMLKHMQDTETKNTLEELTTALANHLLELKQQEALNQQLTQQSLQFVQLSLDMISPTIENFNYGKQQQTNKRSVFDSKA
ncbi:flagellar protein FlgN [Paraliobacillus ryukyuensis]|uniref:flagellar protein FlgN n=1 Tax=Paraliobacillus ryukyuensis TaxID=200904 RepID=UPI0009A5B6B2|nr:flagellar protein FlgN [Paraliobacillus ryukyuensis]